MRSFTSWLAVGLLTALASAAPYKPSDVKRQTASDRLVFCHFMVGIVPNRGSAADYDADIKRAKAAGIDAFALNIGTDEYTETQLNYAYESAANNDFKVFISFDFNWYSPTADAATVGGLIKTFGSKPAQLKVDDKVFMSSFAGDGLDVETVRQTSGLDIYFAPNFHPEQTADSSAVDGALNWVAWDSDGNNRAPKPGQNVTVGEGDAKYNTWLGGKGYVAPVSAWFNTHYGKEVSYSKNWVFPGDLLWYNRWNEILELSPRFLEIITWNDYGESHYIGPLSSKHTDDGNSKWVNDMPHDGWLDMAKPFIAAYKAGKKSPASFITEDQIIYWYRPTLKTLDCSATDTTEGGRPDGVDTLEDAVFVVALLKEAGQVTAVSGSNSKTFEAPAGASAWKLDLGVGSQKFSLARGGQEVISGTSLRDVMDQCPCGIYNYNAFVGTVPAGEPDALDSDGLASLTVSLKVTTCSAAPSLPIGSGAAATPTAIPATNTDPALAITVAVSIPLPTVSPVVVSPPATNANSTLASIIATSNILAPSSVEQPPAPTSETPAPTPEAPVQSTPTSTAVAEQYSAGGCTATVTVSSEIAPTNCLGSGQVWGGPPASPDCCDGASPCCR